MRISYKVFKAGVASFFTMLVILEIILFYHQRNVARQPPNINRIFRDTEMSVLKAAAGLPSEGTGDKYLHIANIITARKENVLLDKHANAGITLCSHSSERNLRYIPKLAANYDGYLSIAVFTYSAKISFILKYLSALHYCNYNVSQKVNIHLCIPLKDFETFKRSVDNNGNMKGISCDILSEKFEESPENFADPQVKYPINTLRNLATKHANTEYILSLDIDHLPSKDMNKKFQAFITSSREVIKPKTLFIVPAFETKVPLTTALTKEGLKYRWANGTVGVFQSKTCKTCHSNTDYNSWRTLRTDQNMHVAYNRNWVEFWEPYFIARKNITPHFYEKLDGFGYDRQSQMFELHVSGFIFAVLNDGFVVHDGYKEWRNIYKDAWKDIDFHGPIYRKFKDMVVKKYEKTMSKDEIKRI